MKIAVYMLLSVSFCLSVLAKEVLEITSMKELKEIMSRPKTVVIMFYAPWCSASKEMNSALNQAAPLIEPEATVVKIDVDKEDMQEATDLFSITAVPTLVVKHTGRILAEDLVESVKRLTKKPTAQTKKNEPLKKESLGKKATPQAAQAKSSPEKRTTQRPSVKKQTSPKK